MKTLLTAFTLIAIATLAHAAPEDRLTSGDHADITVGSTVYKDAKILSVGLDDVIILHDGGMLTIQAKSLSEDLQARFAFDPAAAKAADAARAAAEIERERLERERRASEARVAILQKNVIETHVEVLQVLDDGIMARPYLAYQGSPHQVVVPKTTRHRKGIGLYPDEVVVNTSLALETRRTPVELHDRIFINCDPSGLVDGDHQKALIWKLGTYTYTNTMGGRATIPLFTTDAAEYLLSKEAE